MCVKWLGHRPFKAAMLGSNPAGITILCLRGGIGIHIRFKPGCLFGLRVRLPSQAPCACDGMEAVSGSEPEARMGV